MLSVSICILHYSSCANHGNPASVSVAKVMWTCRCNVNSTSGENWKEPSSSTISTEASFGDDSSEETLNVNRSRWQW